MPLIDFQQLQTLRDLAAGDQHFMDNVIDAFLPQLELTPRALRQAVEEGLLDKAADLAHSLKGSAGNVGAAEVSRLSQQIEGYARNERRNEILPLLGELEAAAAATHNFLVQERSRE